MTPMLKSFFEKLGLVALQVPKEDDGTQRRNHNVGLFRKFRESLGGKKPLSKEEISRKLKQ